MTADDVIDIVQMFYDNGIEVVIDGGWGVDALLGQQTRSHNDLDIAVQHKDVPLLRTLLALRGYADIPQDDTRDCYFVLGDSTGRLVDVHSFTFNTAGELTFGVPYPPDSLTGRGSINGHPVRCITPEWMVQFHTGYPLDADDYHDVKLLCCHFNIPVPPDYAQFESCRSALDV